MGRSRCRTLRAKPPNAYAGQTSGTGRLTRIPPRSDHRFTSMKPQRAITLCRYPGAFFRAPQPLKLRIEGGDRRQCRLPWFRSGRGRWRRRHQGAAGPLVAAEDFAAARTLTAQLLRILVEKNMGVGCHSAPFMLVGNEFLEKPRPDVPPGS